MTLYFFDDVAEKLIAYDMEAKTAREFPCLSIGAEPRPTFSEAEVFPTNRNKAKRKCSVCGKPGHTAQRCSENTPSRYGFADKKRSKTGKGCPECGSPSRHKKDCSKSAGYVKPSGHSKGNDEFQALGDGPRPGAMSHMTFGRVKISQQHDIPAETVARNLDEPVAEIEKAFDSETYDDYVKS